MPEDIRLWEIVDGNNLKELKRTKLDLEERIESWLEKDNSLLTAVFTNSLCALLHALCFVGGGRGERYLKNL